MWNLAQRGATVVELIVASAVLLGITLLTLTSLASSARVAEQSRIEQEAARTAGRLLQRIVREVAYADPATIVFTPTQPERLTFEEVLTYDATVGLEPPGDPDRRVLSMPVTIRRAPVDATSGIWVVELTRATPSPSGGVLAVTICHLPQSTAPVTMRVSTLEALQHYVHGDTTGPCPNEPPVGEILGAYVADEDPAAPGEPGLRFDVRTEGGITYVDIAVAVSLPGPGGVPVVRRVATTVALRNPEGS